MDSREYTDGIDSLDLTFKNQRRKDRNIRLKKERKEQEKLYESIKNKYFDLFKNLTTLSGTVFATSITLATGKEVSLLFAVGEGLLLISTFAGVIYLYSSVAGDEWWHQFSVKSGLELDMSLNKDLMDEFEVENTQKIKGGYDDLLNRKPPFSFLLKIIKVDWIPGIFFTTLFLGFTFILLSLFNSPSPKKVTPITEKYYFIQYPKHDKMNWLR